MDLQSKALCFENMGDAMCQKLKQLKDIMEQTKDLGKGKKSSQLTSGHNVVVVSALEESDVQWLIGIISSVHFKEHVRSANFIKIGTIKEKNWEKQSAEYTFCIYVHREYELTPGASPAQRLKSLSVQGKKPLVVVIDNVRISDNDEKARIIEKYDDVKKYARAVFLFTEREKMSDYQKYFHNSSEQPEPNNDARGFQAAISKQVVFGTKYNVGIFSSSAHRDYSWLTALLATDDFRDHVLSVKPCFISNNGFQQMSEDLSHCTFGILYHTKKNGRVNITDVTDSLYDEELQQLSTTLGKKNTIVIIDDLEDAGNEKKSQILLSQPKIANYASDLILISYEDKTENRGQSAKSKILNYFLRLSGKSLESPKCSQSENERNMPIYSEIQRGAVYDPFLEESHGPHIPPAEQQSSYVERPTPTSSKSTVGIFSRSEESDYFWLKKLLASEEFGHKDVHCYKTLGNDEMFREMAFKVKFMILYHSVKNGKIRLSDTKDSLYHTELEQLSIKFGKRKVIVVIDDLDDIGHKMKQQILEKQPSLGTMVAEIFLFTRSEKKNMDQDKHRSRMSKSTMDKISNMKKCLT
ncbi:uncharacterized protein [Ranitomeya imitator]|uniref:uncharacterized protein isoform X2 n=1 Tax=Ranitomeya imitator TaxID=111125 RepID=UPI0037E94C27